ncbi:sodium- and chloride-dependent glycine transporter 1-like isoform X2 [Dreissena polymorpha]|uniref:sodium- and chloride-dependent glycine transporter 1-like isoform X2 n=1 Tax=Dreissena polymorpha TaxID=45954 RepID=UPI0022651234|nr:sodium- and chloride-dependent glycine transporter 1-like isoform X2 [Dreissena polymorpha]
MDLNFGQHFRTTEKDSKEPESENGGYQPAKQDDDTEGTESSSESGDYSRGVWARKIEFILSVIGYSVGVGNLWRFPYLVMQNGGGAFLIPFFFFLFVCGIPLFYLELCLGQFSGVSCLYVWKFCPLFKGIGYMMLVVSFVYCWYYIMVLVWVLVYLFNSFMSQLPWGQCNQAWNTEHCVTGLASGVSAMRNVSAESFENDTTFSESNISVMSHTASKEFWNRYVLNKSSGLEDFGGIQSHLAIALVVAWVAIFLCLMKGIKSAGKVVYVTALLPYVLLTVFLVKGLTLPGAADGILFYIKPNFSTLLDFNVWVQAAVQVFYSLGPAWGGLITMASYNKFNNNCLRDALICTAADGFTSFYGGFVIFSVIGYIAKEANMEIKDVATSGPGLALVIYPEAITKLPIPQLWSVLFFLMLLSLGIDSQFGVFETLSSGLLDTFPRLRKRKILVTACLCVILLLLDLPFTLNGGIYLYQLVDWYFAAFCVLIISFLECFLIAWVYGANRFCNDIKLMVGRPPPLYIRICWCVFTPVILLTVFLIMCFQYEPPSYDGYKYPMVAKVCGNILAMIPVIPLPIVMIYQIANTPGSLWQKIKFLLKPSYDWGPHVSQYKQGYEQYIEMQKPCGMLHSVRKNLLGAADS